MSILALILVFSASTAAQDRRTLLEWILEEPTWELTSEPVEYGTERIGELVGDNASAVVEYGLIGATRLELTGPAGSVDATLYEMIDSSAAYGLFALRRDWQSPGFELAVIGSEGYRQGNELTFWQSKYVAVLDGAQGATEALGRLLGDNILGQSRKAPVSLFLPAEGLVQESEKYILTPQTLEEATGLDPTELGFDNSVEVAVADYRHPAGMGRVALFLYPTQQLASIHSEAWAAQYGDRFPNTRSGPLFAVVVESNTARLAESILPLVNYQSEVTWTDTLPDPLTLPAMILTIFKFIGLALALTVMVGLVFGGFRIYMKTRYPGFIFGSDDEAEFIQLKLDQSLTGKKLNP